MSQIVTILRKDLTSELRKKGVMSTVLLFSVLVLLTVYYSIDHDSDTLHTFGPPGFWISLLFASFLGLNHFMQSERTNDCMMALRTCPVSPWKIFAGKSLSLLCMLTAVEVILVPVFLMMFEYGYSVELMLFLLVVMLGNIGIAATGTLFSGMLISGRTSAFLLPVILIPILLPLLIAGVRASVPMLSATVDAFNRPGTPLDYAGTWMLILVGMDCVFVSVGSLLSDVVFST